MAALLRPLRPRRAFLLRVAAVVSLPGPWLVVWAARRRPASAPTSSPVAMVAVPMMQAPRPARVVVRQVLAAMVGPAAMIRRAAQPSVAVRVAARMAAVARAPGSLEQRRRSSVGPVALRSPRAIRPAHPAVRAAQRMRRAQPGPMARAAAVVVDRVLLQRPVKAVMVVRARNMIARMGRVVVAAPVAETRRPLVLHLSAAPGAPAVFMVAAAARLARSAREPPLQIPAARARSAYSRSIILLLPQLR